jgi:hypothetical protein
MKLVIFIVAPNRGSYELVRSNSRWKEAVMRRFFFFLLMLVTLSVHAEIRDAGEVDSDGMSAIWRQVISGDEGVVIKAVLVGRMADKIALTTGSPGPFQATVSRVKKYSEPGCARIRIEYKFPSAKTIEGGRRDADINYEQNLCLDGYVPRETAHLNAVPHR